MDCAVSISAAVDKFPKGHKYTLGAKLRDGSEKIIFLVARSNRRQERLRWLEELCNQTEELKLLIQLGKEVKAFDSFSTFSQVIEQVVGLAR